MSFPDSTEAWKRLGDEIAKGLGGDWVRNPDEQANTNAMTSLTRGEHDKFHVFSEYCEHNRRRYNLNWQMARGVRWPGDSVFRGTKWENQRKAMTKVTVDESRGVKAIISAAKHFLIPPMEYITSGALKEMYEEKTRDDRRKAFWKHTVARLPLLTQERSERSLYINKYGTPAFLEDLPNGYVMSNSSFETVCFSPETDWQVNARVNIILNDASVDLAAKIIALMQAEGQLANGQTIET